MDERKCAC
ncbi:hypothetical protein E2R53_03860 [Peribacillus frigoritolerans]|nr:hypothetical protein E2R53_03860 [Peribacillus frigoritolerans]